MKMPEDDTQLHAGERTQDETTDQEQSEVTFEKGDASHITKQLNDLTGQLDSDLHMWAFILSCEERWIDVISDKHFD